MKLLAIQTLPKRKEAPSFCQQSQTVRLLIVYNIIDSENGIRDRTLEARAVSVKRLTDETQLSPTVN